MGRLRLRTGFTATEIFRKYLWYLLRERAFDEAAVEDLLSLRSALSLSNAEVLLTCPPLQFLGVFSSFSVGLTQSRLYLRASTLSCPSRYRRS